MNTPRTTRIQSRRPILSAFVVFSLVLILIALPISAGAQDGCGATYIVRPGDTLSEIAQQCDTSVAALLRANPGIEDPSLIFSGQRLVLPGTILPDTGQPTSTYIVQPGDTLGEIAAQFNTTVEALLNANPQIEDPSLIFPGQRITIPDQVIIPDTGQPTTTYTVQRGDTLSEIAAQFDTSVAALVRANPQIEDPSLIFPGQLLVIPGSIIPNTGNRTSTYVVKAGDTLSEIAVSFNTTVQTLLNANPEIEDPSLIRPGQRITIPLQVIIPETGRPQTVYVVKSGDTLSEIAARFDTTVQELLNANPQIDDPNLIITGQRLTIPDGVTLPDQPTTYIVQPGDSLGEIAAQFNTTVEALLNANPQIEDPSLIFPGQQLTIP